MHRAGSGTQKTLSEYIFTRGRMKGSTFLPKEGGEGTETKISINHEYHVFPVRYEMSS